MDYKISLIVFKMKEYIVLKMKTFVVNYKLLSNYLVNSDKVSKYIFLLVLFG